MYRTFVIVVLLVVLCLGVTIGYFNAQPIEFDYLISRVQMPLIALVMVDFFIAVLLTLLVCGGRILSLKSESRRLRKQLRDAEAELKTLRSIPLSDTPLKNG